MPVTRSALGRVGFLGELYDMRTENFSSRSVFKNKISPELVKTVAVDNVVVEYKFTENISDRFDLLNVESDLQLFFLCGLLEIEGCGKFLNTEKNSSKNITCSFMCKFQTVCEKLFTSFVEVLHLLDFDALDDCQYTHVITEINWGANCLMNLELSSSAKDNKKEAEGKLMLEMKKLAKLIKFEGEGEAEVKDNSFWKNSQIKIQISADVTPKNEMPTSVENFYHFLSNVPNLLKTVNDGKGKPLSYAMIPVQTIRKLANLHTTVENVVREIDESFIISVVCLFEEISSYRLKLEELNKKITENEKYIQMKYIMESKEKLEELKIKESQLKRIISENSLLVKTGENNLKDLIKSVEKFKSHNLNFYLIEHYLNSNLVLERKMETVRDYVSRGIIYLEKGKLFIDELNKNLSSDFIVLIVCDKFQNENPTLYQCTLHYFLSLLDNDSTSTKYAIVDLDLDLDLNNNNANGNRVFLSKMGISTVRCLFFKRGKLINDDMYGDYAEEQNTNFARIHLDHVLEFTHEKPGNRVILKITCPGFPSGICSSSEKIQWKCFRCKKVLEYGFDEYFYCSCGRGKRNYYEFRCNDHAHGVAFVFDRYEFVANELSELRPSNELNILIIGQSGVGKSTWINSIVNYLNHESFEQAMRNEVISTIPINFTTYDPKTGEKHTIKLGDCSANEVTETGESGTQFCSTYCFFWKNKYVRLIDTPGIGDTRGIAKDKENIKNIMSHISNLKELHGICILMKANDSRISAIFSYCLKELLIHMHKGIAKNIVFCFTNARNSFYTPGQTSVLLEKQLESLNIHKELSLGYHNRFCLDNEAFLFLCTLKESKIEFDSLMIKSFGQSWDISFKETVRLLETVSSFKPHPLKKTLSLFTARNRILSLSKPIAEISKTIQMNLTAITKRKEELALCEKTMSELSEKLYVNEIHLEPVPLDLPRTVCTSSQCVRYHHIESYDMTEIEYVTHCHTKCYIKNVVTKAINNMLLKDCSAMKKGVCTVCGCGWQNHMHISFDQKRVNKTNPNKRIQDALEREKSDQERKQEMLMELESKLEKYKKEQEIVIQTSVKLGLFLKENAISVYNDAIADYLRYLIDGEENKPYKTESDEKLLKNLKETLSHYEAEIQVLQQAVCQSGQTTVVPTIEEIVQLENKLYELELTGEDIKKNVQVNRYSSTSSYSYSEIFLQTPKVLEKNRVKGKKKSWLGFGFF